MLSPADLSYDFIAPRKIVFGWGRRQEVGELGRTLGRRAIIVCGSRTLAGQGVVEQITESLRASEVSVILQESLSREPQVEDVDRLTTKLRELGVGDGDFLLALGGGAAIDLAKAAAAMAVNHQSDTVRDYLEGVGRGLEIVRPPLPILAMPSTAGTGCEATKNAVISCHDPPFKKSLRDERILPQIALVDPELTVSSPPAITASSGMDAITQLFESYISLKAKPIPRALAVQGLRLGVSSIVEAVYHAASRHAREKMAQAALLSGVCLANSGLGMAHGLAPALGIHCRVPHGAACAVMLPTALRVNAEVCQVELARLAHDVFDIGPSNCLEDDVAELIDRVDTLCDETGAPRRLSQLGVTADQIPAIVKSSRGSSMSANPRQLSDHELAALLEELL